jgi:cysteine desulfurase
MGIKRLLCENQRLKWYNRYEWSYMKYFDYAASTPMDEEVIETYLNVTNRFYAHPDTYKYSIQLRGESKKIILDYLNLKEHEITYTSGGTEANNLAIVGLARTFSGKKHFITSFYEHSSVYDSFKYLESLGHEVDYVMPRKDGLIYREDVVGLIKKNTALISIMSVNNELGVVNDIDMILKGVRKTNDKILFMCDYVQGLGKVDIKALADVDLITISAHKIYGPKGIGCLIRRKGINLNKIIHGGSNEDGLRGGTQNLSNEVAFAKAIKVIFEQKRKVKHKIKANVDYLVEGLNTIDCLYINTKVMSSVLSVSLNFDMMSESFVQELIENDIIISTKSACSKPDDISRSLQVLGFDEVRANRTYRISVSHKTTFEDIDYFISTLKILVDRRRNEKSFNQIW